MTAGRWRPVVALLLVGALLGVVPVPAHAALVGSVSGKVTAGGRPLANAWVTLIPVRPTGDRAGRGFSTTTDARGEYRFGDVYTDHVKVQVRAPAAGGLVTTYWPDAHTFADAGVVRVTSAGATADVDLAPGGSIRGRVVDARTGAVVPGARVTAHVVEAVGWETVGTPALGAATTPGGFALLDLPPVPVVLHVAPPVGSDLVEEWFDGEWTPGAAQRFDGAADTSGVLVELTRREARAGVVGTPRAPSGATAPAGSGRACDGGRARGADAADDDSPGEEVPGSGVGWPGLAGGVLGPPAAWLDRR